MINTAMSCTRISGKKANTATALGQCVGTKWRRLDHEIDNFFLIVMYKHCQKELLPFPVNVKMTVVQSWRCTDKQNGYRYSNRFSYMNYLPMHLLNT